MSDPVQIDLEEAIAESTSVFLDGKVELRKGDCRDVLRSIPDNSIDSVVTDPPYALVSIVKRFGGENAAPAKSNGPTGAYARASKGFMGKQWDTGETAFAVEFWAEVLRVLKPGGFVVAFSGTRTYHRMACAIEDAGFEIRDQIGWLYGSGFPKSQDVSKFIDKAAGVERTKIAVGAPVKRMIPGADQNGTGSWIKDNGREYQPGIELPVTGAAKEWDGWGTALKPAWEPVCLARKALVGTVVDNVLRHGTGAINVDGCRVETSKADQTYITERIAGFNNTRSIGGSAAYSGGETMDRSASYDASKGRFPANIIHDGSDEVVAAFPDSKGQQADVTGNDPSSKNQNVYGTFASRAATTSRHDDGSAARFFYTAKADAEDRIGSEHPTVKPVDLMQYLVRLVTRKGGTVLDPFAGTGTTGEAAWREGMKAILVEREPEYQADIARRMDLITQPTKRAAVAKTKNKLDDPNDLPLFASK